MSAVEFDNLRSIHQAINRIQEYLARSVSPLPLQQLGVLRITNNGGETQEQLTHRTIDAFRNARMFDTDGNQMMKMMLLHTIQEKGVMPEVLRTMRYLG